MLRGYRKVYRILSLSVVVIMFINIAGCGGGSSLNSLSLPVVPRADIVLDGTEKEVAATVKAQFSRLQELANNPGRAITIQLGENVEFMEMAFVKNAAANYEHPRFIRQNTGEIINLVWGMKGIIPTIKGTDDNGKTLVIGEKSLEFPVEDINIKSRDTTDFIALGIKIAAVTFAIWLGAGIAKAVFAAVGWLAFNAMVLGLVVAAGAVVISISKPILDFFGINSIEDIKNIFMRTTESIVALFNKIKSSLPA